MIRCSVNGWDCSRQSVSGEGVGKVGIPGRGVTSDRCAWLKLIGGSNFKAIDWRDGIYNCTYRFGASGWTRLDEVVWVYDFTDTVRQFHNNSQERISVHTRLQV